MRTASLPTAGPAPRCHPRCLAGSRGAPMARPDEERYSDLLRHLAAPSTIDPDGLVESLREVERLHSMGHITSAQLAAARQDEHAQGEERASVSHRDEGR